MKKEDLKIGRCIISGDACYHIIKIEGDKVIAKDEGFPAKIKVFEIKNLVRSEDVPEDRFD